MKKLLSTLLFLFPIILSIFLTPYTFSLAPSVAQAAARLHLPPNYLKSNSGLVGYWTFDGKDLIRNVADTSGQSNTGYMVAAATSSQVTAGPLGQALSFDGTTQYVNVTSSTGIPTGASQRTIVMWFNARAYDTATAYALFQSSDDTTTGGRNIYLFAEDNAVSVGFNSNRLISPKNTLSINKWYHLILVVPSGASLTTDVKVYINGTLQTLSTESGSAQTLNTNTAHVTIGGSNTGVAPRFPGSIDDVRIYNRALSAAEVLNLYTIGKVKVSASATKTKVNMSPTTLLTGGLVGYWTFDGATTTWSSATAGITGDVSGNYNTGTLQSMTQSASPVPGKIGQALWFDGSNNDYISVRDIPTSPTSARSWGGWVYLDSNTNSNLKVVLSHYESTHGYNLFTDSSEQMSCGIGDGGSHYFGYTSSLSFNTWTHLFCVFDGSLTATARIKTYKNGVEVNSITGPATLTDPVANFIIGDDDDNANRNWFGRLDDIRVYSRALSASEVLQLYNSTR